MLFALILAGPRYSNDKAHSVSSDDVPKHMVECVLPRPCWRQFINSDMLCNFCLLLSLECSAIYVHALDVKWMLIAVYFLS